MDVPSTRSMNEQLARLKEAAEALIEAIEDAEDASYVTTMDRAVAEIQNATNRVVNMWREEQNPRPPNRRAPKARRKVLW